MSKTSIRHAFKENQFNLRTISIALILIDLSLLPIFWTNNLMKDFLQLLLYEGSIILGLMFGLRGLARYKSMMLELQSIAGNRVFDLDERDARLVQIIHHACLELGLTAEMRNKKYGLFTKKNKTPGGKNSPGNKKKTKNSGGERRMIWDEVVWKQFGYTIVGVWGMFSPVIALFLAELYFHWSIILFLTGSWVFIDVFILFYIHYVFKIEPKVKGVDIYVENKTET